ncbi:MAG: hypothetical protein AB1306_07640 [Nitrospirota bacterium]
MNKTLAEQNAQNRTALTERQHKAISAVLNSKNISEGVKAAKISRTQFYEFMKNPDFKAEFKRQRNELIDLALHELKISTAEAVGVLRKLLSAKNEGIQFKTATAIIENVLKSIQIENLEERLTKIEKEVLKK